MKQLKPILTIGIAIIFITLFLLIVFEVIPDIIGGSESCYEYINKYVKDNNLSQDNIHDNGQGFWWVEKNGKQLPNCLEKGGRVTGRVTFRSGIGW